MIGFYLLAAGMWCLMVALIAMFMKCGPGPIIPMWLSAILLTCGIAIIGYEKLIEFGVIV